MEDKFEKFDNELEEKFNDVISEILKSGNGKQVYTIGFITTDDFYGFYIPYDYMGDNKEMNIDDFYEWSHEYESNDGFMYKSVVNVIETTDIDFTASKTKDKWMIATALMNIIAKHIKAIPDEIFTDTGHNREDVFFFATQGDGNYMNEMYVTSRYLFNNPATIEKFKEKSPYYWGVLENLKLKYY